MQSSDSTTPPKKEASPEPSGKPHIPRGRELKAWTEKWKLEDKWWCSIHDRVFGPYTIAEIEERCIILPSKKIMVIHVISSENPDMKWIEMDATPLTEPDPPPIDLDKCRITEKINLRPAEESQP